MKGLAALLLSIFVMTLSASALAQQSSDKGGWFYIYNKTHQSITVQYHTCDQATYKCSFTKSVTLGSYYGFKPGKSHYYLYVTSALTSDHKYSGTFGNNCMQETVPGSVPNITLVKTPRDTISCSAGYGA